MLNIDITNKLKNFFNKTYNKKNTNELFLELSLALEGKKIININLIRNIDGESILYFFIKENKVNITEELLKLRELYRKRVKQKFSDLEYDSSIKCKINVFSKLLILSMSRGEADYLEMIRLLIQYNVNINELEDGFILRPIQLAIKNKMNNIVFEFLKHPKINLNISDGRGNNLIEFTEEHNNSLTETIKSAISNQNSNNIKINNIISENNIINF